MTYQPAYDIDTNDDLDADRCEACGRGAASMDGFYPDLCLDCSAATFDAEIGHDLTVDDAEFDETDFAEWRLLGWKGAE
jgi:hypothetical protein